MESSLDSVLSEQATDTTDTTETQQAQTSADQVMDAGEQATGEDTGTPPEQSKDTDPLDKASQGLKAAAIAERQKRQEAERRAQVLEQQLQALKTPQKPQQTQQGEQEPTREQFGSDAEYIRALARHEAKQLREAERAEEVRVREESEARQRAEYIQRTATEIVTRGQEKYQDFDAVINGALAPHLTPALHQTLLLSDRGHDVAYWLGKNPAEAQRVARMPPLMLTRELTLIEAKLDAAPATTQERRQLPETLTQARDARGRFDRSPAYDGPTPLDAVLARKT